MQDNLPEAFIKKMKSQLGEKALDFFDALAEESPTSVRLNPSKPIKDLNHFLIEGEVPWCDKAYYLKGRPPFTFDPFFHAGAYYVQEASSMFLEHIVRLLGNLNSPVRVLDLCAAPGGKSTLLASLISDDSLLVSNEVVSSRASILVENIQKWGKKNCIVTNNNPEAFVSLEGYFDLVLVDAPCSGEGMFRKDPNSVKEWSEGNVKACAARQQKILEVAAKLVKREGYLIYSTCTYNKEENEGHFKSLKREFKSVQIPIDPLWQIEVSEEDGVNGYRFYPNRIKGEGFFISCLQKIAGKQFDKRIEQLGKEKATITRGIENWVKLDEMDSISVDHRDILHSFPHTLENDRRLLSQVLHIKAYGVSLGTFIRNDFIPGHQLALSQMIAENVCREEVDYHTAIRFLQKQEIKIEQRSESAWVLINYNSMPLGWVKQVGKRLNNYYPKEWRIRSEKVVAW